ncbi:hypothetical protein EDB85DRAFT_1893539 [Lactarius pseudohatsudake]|nr:hypothetical protein EDB85DRAFT_1893539 [Lactarius pseudohatsudake]
MKVVYIDHDPEISEQSELEHFSAVLWCAHQIAIQLETEKEKSRKRKTLKHYNGKSMRTSYQHKKARLQLAENGFFGVFEYIALHNQTGAKRGSSGASNLAQEPSAKERPVLEEEEESSLEDGAVEADMSTAATSATSATVTPASTTPASVMPTSATPTSMTPASVMPTSTTPTSMTPASMTPTSMDVGATPVSVTAACAMTASVVVSSSANATTAGMTAPSATAIGAVTPNATAIAMASDVAVEAMEVEVDVVTFDAATDWGAEVVVEAEKSHTNGPQDDNWWVLKVRDS